ncbi:MAG: bifunctional methylenetetrahydrofolate dehydrogenase/methenyltetrahydrofolate cyclohydrolase FolD [Myxococcales bacterium]
MAAKIIDGKAIAARVRAEVAQGVKELVARTGLPPGLAAVRVGEDPASIIYVRNKIKACAEVGIASFEHALPERTSQEDLLGLVARLNADERVHGILVQLPLPKHIDPDRVIDLVSPEKDVDGFGPRSVAALAMGRPGLRACTPSGCLRLLDEVETKLPGARALVIGRSLIVGKPMALLLLERNATVTMAHSRTQDLPGEVARADVLVAAIGKAELIKGSWVKPGATVIDVGMNRLPDGKLKGDVEFAAASERARAITPVPGGVGPMTIAYLLRNTLTAARHRAGMET